MATSPRYLKQEFQRNLDGRTSFKNFMSESGQSIIAGVHWKFKSEVIKFPDVEINSHPPG